MQFWTRPPINNVLVAAAAASAVAATSIELDLGPGWRPAAALVFFAALLVYSLDRAIPAPEDRPGERGDLSLRIGIAIGALGALAAASHLPAGALWLIAPLAWVSLAYSAPLWPLKRRLKAIRGAKLAAIALVWAGAIVALPWLSADSSASVSEAGALMVERALMIGALTWPFEVRDEESDRAAGLVAVGGRRRALALLALALAALFAIARALIWGAPVWPAAASYAAMAALIAPGHEPRHPAYYAALDASIALPWALGSIASS